MAMQCYYKDLRKSINWNSLDAQAKLLQCILQLLLQSSVKIPKSLQYNGIAILLQDEYYKDS